VRLTRMKPAKMSVLADAAAKVPEISACQTS
jgi:hypothetical protein